MPNKNRKYNLPKYICYDMAESRNRERSVFQTNVTYKGKNYKNNHYSVREALLWVADIKMNTTKQWNIKDVADYLGTYVNDMDTFIYTPSNTPKSPSVRKREDKKRMKLGELLIVNGKRYVLEK